MVLNISARSAWGPKDSQKHFVLPRKQRRGDEGGGGREALSSSALDLREARFISSARKEGEPEESGRLEGSWFPAETWDAAELWTAPRERGSLLLAPPGFWLLLESPSTRALSSPGLRPPNPGKILRFLSERVRGWSDSFASGPIREEGLRFWKSSPCG